MATTDASSSHLVWGYPVLLGFALGMTLTSLVTIAQLSTPPELIATASGLIISMRSLGGTIGICVYNALFVAQLNHLGDEVAAAVLPMGLPRASLDSFITALNTHDASALASIPGVTPQAVQSGVSALLGVYAQAFRRIWITAACFVAVAAIAAAFLQDQKKEFNLRVDAPMEEADEP